MFQYERKIQYHETDKMGISHHSNYVKWMEEARVAFLDSINLPFQAIEARGIASPVMGLSIAYKKPTTFGDTVLIEVAMTKYTGVQLEVGYTIRLASTGIVAATAASKHCFLQNGRVISLQRADPEMHRILDLDFKRCCAEQHEAEGTKEES